MSEKNIKNVAIETSSKLCQAVRSYEFYPKSIILLFVKNITKAFSHRILDIISLVELFI